MKRLIFILLLWQSAAAQECPHFYRVLNVYRREKAVIDGYAKDFIAKNPDLFLYKQAYIGKHDLEAPKGFTAYTLVDSGVIANAVYVNKTDTFICKIGFLSKDNRTSVELLSVINCKTDYITKEFLGNMVHSIIEKYHTFLRGKNNDAKHW